MAVNASSCPQTKLATRQTHSKLLLAWKHGISSDNWDLYDSELDLLDDVLITMNLFEVWQKACNLLHQGGRNSVMVRKTMEASLSTFYAQRWSAGTT